MAVALPAACLTAEALTSAVLAAARATPKRATAEAASTLLAAAATRRRAVTAECKAQAMRAPQEAPAPLVPATPRAIVWGAQRSYRPSRVFRTLTIINKPKRPRA